MVAFRLMMWKEAGWEGRRGPRGMRETNKAAAGLTVAAVHDDDRYGVVRRGFFNDDGAPLNLSSHPRVLRLRESEEEVRGKINRTKKPQRRRSPERVDGGSVRLQNRQGGGSPATKLGQEDQGRWQMCCASFGERRMDAREKWHRR
jgi:hypothetical protein